MDKEMLKKKLHEQVDAMDDVQSLQHFYEAALAYNRTLEKPNAAVPQTLEATGNTLPQSSAEEWISHDDLMELAKTWPKK